MDARLASCVGSGSRSSGGSSSLAQHVRGRWTDEMSEMHEMEGSTQLGGQAGLWARVGVRWSRSDGALYGVPLCPADPEAAPATYRYWQVHAGAHWPEDGSAA